MNEIANSIILSEEVIFRKERFGGLIVFRESELILTFNNVGYEILKLCKNRETIDEIVSHITKRFRVDRQKAEEDIYFFLLNAKKNNVVSFDGDLPV